jgi:hypothetical protein
MKDEALKLALEALEYASTGNRRPEIIGPAITAIREALAQPAQEPDIYPEEARDMGLEALAYYTTPPAAQRTWVGLTDGERNTIGRHHAYVDNIIRATEAKLKEKNHD